MSSTIPSTFTRIHMLLFLLFLSTAQTNELQIKAEKRILPLPNNITLELSGIATDTENPSIIIRREVDGQSSVFTDYEFQDCVDDMPETCVAFTLTPELEGTYSYGIGQTISGNSVTLVAYPEPDKAITAITSYSAVFQGTSPPIQCEFRRGNLAAMYYTVEWWKGEELLVTLKEGIQNSSKYEVLDDFSLVISNIVAQDASEAYYCIVKVRNEVENVVYTNFGVNYQLVVTGDLNLTQGLTDHVFKVGDSYTFYCTATGIPQPDSAWLIDGLQLEWLPSNQAQRYSVTKQQEDLASGSFSQSTTLTIQNMQTVDSGRVQCIFSSSKGSGIHYASSTSTLIVIGKPFTPDVVSSGSGVYLSVSFPEVIPTAFILNIRFSDIETDNTMRSITAFDPSFANTDTVSNFLIPVEDLPPFPSFLTIVAVEVNGIVGPYSSSSGVATFIPEDSGDGPCTALSQTTSPTFASESCLSLSNVVAVICVMAILFIMATILLIVILFFVIRAKYRHKQPIRDDGNLRVYWSRSQSDRLISEQVDHHYPYQDVDRHGYRHNAAQDTQSPSHISVIQNTSGSLPEPSGSHLSAETTNEGIGVTPQPPPEREAPLSSQYEAVETLPTHVGLPRYSSVVSSEQERKLSELEAPVPTPSTPSSTEPLPTDLNTEPTRGIAISQRESPVMVDTGTSSSPPAAFSLSEISPSTTSGNLAKKSSESSSDISQQLQGTADSNDQIAPSPKASPSLAASHHVLRNLSSFKEATRSLDRSPMINKRMNSQEERKKKKHEEMYDEYDIIDLTPPKEITV